MKTCIVQNELVMITEQNGMIDVSHTGYVTAGYSNFRSMLYFATMPTEESARQLATLLEADYDAQIRAVVPSKKTVRFVAKNGGEIKWNNRRYKQYLRRGWID